jgi:hypothetical protein
VEAAMNWLACQIDSIRDYVCNRVPSIELSLIFQRRSIEVEIGRRVKSGRYSQSRTKREEF